MCAAFADQLTTVGTQPSLSLRWTDKMGKTVIILGAGWAGLPLAHKLLKYTVPKVPDLKIVLVSPNSHFFWNVAATRGIIPGEIPDEHLFIPIAPAFKQHTADKFEFILGAAESVNPNESTVNITLQDGSSQCLSFDQLIVATGSRLVGNLPLKLTGTYGAHLTDWHGLQHKVAEARRIVISGGGPTGVEVAGELAAKYGSTKDITLLTSSNELMLSATPSVRRTVSQDLKKLGVKVVYNNSVASVSTDTDTDTGETHITMADGSIVKADLHLPFHGVTVNTSFLPVALLDDKSNLKLDKKMRAVGTPHIWGIGDVGDTEAKQLTVTDNQIIHLASALHATLTGGQVSDYVPVSKQMVFASLGKNHGTGQIGNWRLWGFMVNYVKGRSLFVDAAPGYVGGKHLRHASM
jgi:NADH dehydrogenase FAD-containing subunit